MGLDSLFKTANRCVDKRDITGAYDAIRRALGDPAFASSDCLPQMLDIIAYCYGYFRARENFSDGGIYKPPIVELDKVSKLAMDVTDIKDEERLANMAVALTTFGRAYYDHESYSQAERLLLKGFEYVDRSDMPGKASFLNDYEVLIQAVCWQGRYEDALEIAKRWLGLAHEELVENDIYTATIHKTFGEVLSAMGRFEEAEQHYKRCLQLHEAEGCDFCRDVPGALRAYAKLLRSTHRNDEAAAMDERAAAIDADTQE